MTYALVLLAALAMFSWAVLGGLPVPGLQEARIQDQARELYGRARDRIRAAVREAVRKEMHDAVDEALQ